MKTCTKCGEEKDLVAFGMQKNGKDGRRADCRDCVSHANRLRWYGITAEEYERRFEEQEGVCGICGQPETLPNRSLSVDHDHETLAIRGLLCHACNTAIGLLSDSPARLRRAIDYLERAQC